MTLPRTTRRRKGSSAAAPGGRPEVSPLRTFDLPTADRVLRRAELTIARKLEGVGPGAHRSARLGEGLDLVDIREYAPGDDVRTVDWNVTARTGHPHVRVYEADRETSAFFVLDRSASMGFGTAAATKEALLRQLVAAVCVLILRHGNRLGGMLFGNERRAGLPLSCGRRAALRLLQLLDDEPPAERVGSRLDLALEETGRVVRRRSIIVVVSDWLDAGAWEDPLRRLAHRHEVIAVEIRDPREYLLPAVGPLVLEDPETGRQIEIDTSRPGLREAFRAAGEVASHQRALALAGAGAARLEVCTDRDWLADLIRFLERRRARR
ncbi:MAG: DUF58 domain-containing protein [Actinomycetota bacterium]